MGIAGSVEAHLQRCMSFRKQTRIEVMMNLKKKALALAVAAAAVGAGVAQAQQYVPTVAQNSLGQALIYPYMTAKDGWQSFLHVVNTSGATVAAKVRFRAATDSADVLDFVVVLSPYDVWTGVVEQNTSGGYGFRPTDNSCTAPVIGKDVFQPFPIQTSEVYAEVITMGITTSTTGTLAKAAKHDTSGMPADCGVVAAAFQSQDPTQLKEFDPNYSTSNTAPTGINLTSTAVSNHLTGKFDLVHVAKGWSGADRATVIADFGAPTCGGTNCGSMTGPMFAYTNMWMQVYGDWDHPTLAEGTGGLDGINAALAKTALINEWVLNPNLGELSPWIVTFPTKKLTVDAFTAYNTAVTSGPKLAFGDKNNCIAASAYIYNREELTLRGGVSPGASMPPLCYEANVINFESGSINSSSVLNSSVAVTFPTSYTTGVLAGWMQLNMPSNSIIAGFYPVWTSLPGWVSSSPTASTGSSYAGRPVVGFNLTARATPSDTVLYDHAYLP